MAAASSRARLAGLCASSFSPAQTYSAQVPVHHAEHFIAGPESLHTVAHCLDPTCHIESRNTVSWFEQASNQAHGERSASHAEAVAYVEARCVNVHQHLIVVDHRCVDVPEFQDVVGDPYSSWTIALMVAS